MRGDGVDYYVADLVARRGPGAKPGVAGESPGEWTGRGSAALGLRGAVAAPDLAEVLAGRDPPGDGALRQAHGGPAGVPAFDLVFAAPKSVSLLHLLAPRELAAAAGAATRAAVADAVGYLEAAGLGVRRTRRWPGPPPRPPPGPWPPDSSTGPAAPSTPTSTPTWWWPTWPRGWTDGGRRSTAVACSSTGGPLEAVYDASLRHHLTRTAGVAWQRAPVGPVGGGRRGSRCCAGSSRSGRRRSTSRSHRVAGGRGSPGVRRVAFLRRPAGQGPGRRPSTSCGPAWRRRAADLGSTSADLVRGGGSAAAPTGRRERIRRRG